MKREILFKAKRIDNDEWIVGSLIVDGDNSCRIVLGKNEPGTYGWFDVIPETVCQFTGLLDKNGNKIFEGDKLFYAGTNHSSMVVKFENCCFVGEGPFNTHPLPVYFNASDFEFIEVIGSIHDKEGK